MDLWEWCVSAGEVAHGGGGLPVPTSHHWRSWNKPARLFFVFFMFFFSQHWQPRGGAPLWCLSVWSLDRTRLLPQSETVAVGWSFYSKDNLLCVFHPAAVGSALLAPLREIMEMIVRRGLSSCPDTNPRVHVRYLITLGWFPPADFGAKMLVVNYIAKTKLIFIFGQGLLLSFFCQEVIMLPESGPGPGPGALWAGCLLVISILLAKVLWTSLSLSLWFSIFPFLRTCHRSSASPDDLCLDGLYLSIIPKQSASECEISSLFFLLPPLAACSCKRKRSFVPSYHWSNIVKTLLYLCQFNKHFLSTDGSPAWKAQR